MTVETAFWGHVIAAGVGIGIAAFLPLDIFGVVSFAFGLVNLRLAEIREQDMRKGNRNDSIQ